MKKLIILSVLTLPMASVWSTPILDPGSGHYYDVIQAPSITWAAARIAALGSSYLGLQGHLATITSASEHSYVNLAIQANGGGEMWAGGFQAAGETDPMAGWTWVNGEGSFPGFNSSSPYAFWNGGEPNDAYGPGSEQFLGLNLGAGFNDEGNLGLITGYVIEYDPNTINENLPDGGATISMLGGALALLVAAARRSKK